MNNSKPTRNHVVVILGVGALLLMSRLYVWPSYLEDQSVKEIERVGDHVRREAVGPQWLRRCGVEFNRVHVVSLSDLEITDDELRHLRGLSGLRGVWLAGTRITDEGLKTLSRQTTLTAVSLEETDITDEGLRYLSRLSNLKVVTLNGTQVTDKGIGFLQQSLPNCQILR